MRRSCGGSSGRMRLVVTSTIGRTIELRNERQSTRGGGATADGVRGGEAARQREEEERARERAAREAREREEREAREKDALEREARRREAEEKRAAEQALAEQRVRAVIEVIASADSVDDLDFTALSNTLQTSKQGHGGVLQPNNALLREAKSKLDGARQRAEDERRQREYEQRQRERL